MRKETLYTLPQVVRLLGVEYERVRYAAGFRGIGSPKRIGKAMIFNKDGVAALRQHFHLEPPTTEATAHE